METKKSPQKDLSKKQGLFFNIGLMTSVLLVLAAFEFNFVSLGDERSYMPEAEGFEEQLDVPLTEFAPPPPVLEQPEIREVPNDELLEEQLFKFNSEFNENDVLKKPAVMKPGPKKELKKPEIKEEEDFERVFDIVEKNAEPEGGMEAFYQYIAKEMKYPAVARRMGTEGKVFVQFVVDKDGTLTEIEVVKGIGTECDEEAVRVLKKAKAWKPAEQRGRAVRVKMVIPLVFKLK